MSNAKLPDLDPVIHSRVRLGILSILASVKEATFNFLKEKTGATDGNLSANITKLEEVGYVKVIKEFEGKKPVTRCSITAEGKKAFKNYIETLESYINPKV
ncbi:MAG: transcriptional regulator [Calditrichia bacterium]